MRSVRTQLIVWNVAILTVILIACGSAVRYRMQAGLIATVDRELEDRVRPALNQAPPPRVPEPPMRPQPGAGGGLGQPDEEGMDRNGGQGPQGFDGQPPPPGDQQGGPVFGNGGFPGGMPPGAMGDSAGQTAPFRTPPFGRPPAGRGRPDVRVIDPSGTDRFGHPPFDKRSYDNALAGTPDFDTIRQNGIHYRIYSTPRRQNGSIVQVVQAEESLAPVDAEIADVDRALLTMIPLGLIAAALGAAFITMRSLRPVHRIGDAVGKIQAEDLSRRLPVNGSDEFARLSETLNAMLARLQRSFEEQRRFTMDASHELKTPLTVIKAKTSVALTRERSAESYQSTLQTIDQAADRMTRIVQDLLLLAQADSGQLGSDRTPVSLRYVVESALEGVHAEGRPSITVDIPEPSPTVSGNSSELARAFRNLIENAVRHTPTTGSVCVSVRNSTAGVEAVVRDTGEGIAPEHLSRLGTRFYRVDTARTRDTGGTGLGLAICKGIIEAHGGSFRIQSTLGQGTSIHIRLPR